MQGDAEEKEVSILYDTRILCFQVPLSISFFPSVSLPLGPVFPNLMHRAGKRRKAPSAMLRSCIHYIALPSCISKYAIFVVYCQLSTWNSIQSTRLVSIIIITYLLYYIYFCFSYFLLRLTPSNFFFLFFIMRNRSNDRCDTIRYDMI